MYIVRDGVKIKLTEKEKRKAWKEKMLETYLKWAKEKAQSENKTLGRETLKTIATQTYDAFINSRSISNEEEALFENVFNKIVKQK